MIKIEILDPQNESKETLEHIADFLLSLANKQRTEYLTTSASIHKVSGAIVVPSLEPHANHSISEMPMPSRLIPEYEVPSYGDIPLPVLEENNIELDTMGMPWDEKIHAKNKSKNADGTWRLSRGAKGSKEKEIAIPIPPSEVDKLQIEEPQHTFLTLMQKITNAINEKKITPAQVAAIVQSFGIASPALASTRPDLIPQIFEAIDLAIN